MEHAALISRDAKALRTLFWDRLGAEFEFIEQETPYGFLLQVPEPNRPLLTFGRDFGYGEKELTMWRFLEILPVVQNVTKYRLSQSTWNLSDCGPAGHVAFCGYAGSLLVADCEFVKSGGYAKEREVFRNQPLWSDRSDVPFWRGSTTGHRIGPTILDLPRIQLCRLGRQAGYDFALTSIEQAQGEEDMIINSGLLGDFQPWEILSRNRFNIDIDGNTSAWSSLFRKLLAGGVVLKVCSSFRQWYYDLLVPWQNYVPIRSDMTDLVDIIQLLRADPNRAQAIGRAGRDLACSLTYERELEASTAVILRHTKL